MDNERMVYGCKGANTPEAAPFIEEVNGVLTYTCPECREAIAAMEESVA